VPYNTQNMNTHCAETFRKYLEEKGFETKFEEFDETK
jgi:hypothetical protein